MKPTHRSVLSFYIEVLLAPCLASVKLEDHRISDAYHRKFDVWLTVHHNSVWIKKTN